MMTTEAGLQHDSRVLTAFADLERLAPAWERLWEASAPREVFTTFAWARACWQAYGGHRALCTPVVTQEGRAVGILPLAMKDRTVRFLGAPHADYNDLLCEEEDGPAILEYALEELTRAPLPWDRCVLENLAEESRLVAALDRLSPGLRGRLKLTVSGSCSALDLRADRPGLLRAALGKESLRRHHKKLSKLGEVRLRHLEDPEEIECHLPTFFRLHVARRALAGDRSLFCRDEPRAFYRALVRELDARAALRFAVLEVAGRPVAYHLGFECGGKFIWYKPAFDVAYWDYSPGEVLIKALLEYVAGRELEEFDFTTGDEAFKGRFANRVRKQYAVHFFPPRARGRMYHLGLLAKEYLKSKPRTFSAVRGAARGLRGLWAKARAALRRHGLGGSTRTLVRRTWRAGVYARDEVLIFCREQTADLGEPLAAVGAIDVRPGGLLELAALAQEYPDFLDGERLQSARERLKRGDRLHVARRGGVVIHLAWTGMRDEIRAAHEVGPECRLGMGEPAPVIFDCWTAPAFRGQEVYPRVLSALARDALREHRRVWIYCLRENRASHRGIAKAGFRLHARMGRSRLFGRTLRTWVKAAEG
jgi:CelD/BcsL family acetyltransferase involved in cellulose biosynthesis